MLMLGFLSGKSLRRDVGVMVQAFVRGCPPPTKIGHKSISKKKVGESLEALYSQMAVYVRDKRLGILGRARLAKALQDEMRLYEYPDELVSRLVNAVTVNALAVPDRR